MATLNKSLSDNEIRFNLSATETTGLDSAESRTETLFCQNVLPILRVKIPLEGGVGLVAVTYHIGGLRQIDKRFSISIRTSDKAIYHKDLESLCDQSL